MRCSSSGPSDACTRLAWRHASARQVWARGEARPSPSVCSALPPRWPGPRRPGSTTPTDNVSVVGAKVKGLLIDSDRGFDLALAASAKFPVGRIGDLTSTDTTDLAVMLLGHGRSRGVRSTRASAAAYPSESSGCSSARRTSISSRSCTGASALHGWRPNRLHSASSSRPTLRRFARWMCSSTRP